MTTDSVVTCGLLWILLLLNFFLSLKTVIVREKLCTTDIELLVVSLSPHYLPKEFPQLFLILEYIHPRDNAATATEHN